MAVSATLNASGQFIPPSSVSVDATATLRICGKVTAYTAATATAPGSITIGGTTIPIAVGTVISGNGLITIGADLCLDITLNRSEELLLGN